VAGGLRTATYCNVPHTLLFFLLFFLLFSSRPRGVTTRSAGSDRREVCGSLATEWLACKYLTYHGSKF